MLWICDYDLFRRNFGFGVDAQRIDFVRLRVISFSSVKHEICGKENERNISTEFGQQSSDFDIQFAREVRLFLTDRALT